MNKTQEISPMEEMKTRLKNGEIVFVLAARAGHMRAVRERFEYSGPRRPDLGFPKSSQKIDDPEKG